MADNTPIAIAQQMIGYSDESNGQLRLLGASFNNPETGYTEISIVRYDTVTGNVITVGTFQLLAADWTTLQAQYPTLQSAPLT